MLVTLPTGILDGVDHFNVVELDELRGKQQNYLADKELVSENIGHIPKILEDMILSLQTAQGLKWKGKISEVIWKLPTSDIETVLVKVRENTYGPRFYHVAVCTHEGCEHVNKNLRLDLDTLEIKRISPEILAKKPVTVLPKSNQEVELKPLFLRDLFDAIKITTGKGKELITSILALSVKRLGDKDKVTSKDIDALSMRDIMYMQEQADTATLEGSIDTDITIECEKCSKDFEMKLNVFHPSFFAPTKG
jgi:hypothetical protein